VAKKRVVEEKTKVAYQDTFQEKTNQAIEDLGNKLAGKGKLILYGMIGIIVVAIAVALFYNWSLRANNAAVTALGKAIEINEAQITETPIPNNPAPTFKTEKERSDKAIEAFQKVADTYGSPYREQAQYFIAVNHLRSDRENGLKELEGLTSNGNREVANLAKFALAGARQSDGKPDEALKLYDELSNAQNLPVALDTINFQRASILEKQGKTEDAVNIYFALAKTAREAKDSEGKPLPMTATAREAADKLQKLNADKFKELPPEPTPDFGL
jgi:tetratricopeptide (TPR) repeat protein